MKDKQGYERGACNSCGNCPEFVHKEDSVRCERCNCKPIHHDLIGSDGSAHWESSHHRLVAHQLQLTLAEDCRSVGSSCALLGCGSPVGFNPNTGEEFHYCSAHRDGVQQTEWIITDIETDGYLTAPIVVQACASSGLGKCAIPECNEPCHVDESGVAHNCCGFTHAMEYQRRLAIASGATAVVKGVTHCLLPECDVITWPFENYCGRTHADIGKARQLIPPASSLSEASEASTDPRKCIIPGCNKQKFMEGDTVHPYCGKTHADFGKQHRIFPSTEHKSDQCDMEGCTRPKRRDGTIVYDYCCLQHAQNDAPNREASLTKREEVEKWLGQFPEVRVVSLDENPEAVPGGRLFERYRQKMLSLPRHQRQTCLAFHGTNASNIPRIFKNGYDPKLRQGQAYGAGEYFAATPTISMGYCSNGKKMIINELLLGKSGIHHTKHGDIIVMKDPAHDLPRFVLIFS